MTGKILVMFILIIFVIVFKLANCKISVEYPKFNVIYEWEAIDFNYRSEMHRINAIRHGEFIINNVLISDIAVYDNRMYLTIPRLLNGVPATLGWVKVPNNKGRPDPLIQPFPSWEYNREGNCQAMQFVQGIVVDRDGLMWVVDSGQLLKRHCSPKLLIFNLKNNGSTVLSYTFPETVVSQFDSFLNKIVVDNINDGYAYITDKSVTDPGIVVYSRNLNRSWKIRHNSTMKALEHESVVNPKIYQFTVPIHNIALGPFVSKERNVYYTPISSYHLYSMPASILRDPAIAKDINKIVTYHGTQKSQISAMIMDKIGNLYICLPEKNALVVWDTSVPLTRKNQLVIARDTRYIKWVDGISFDENGFLYVVINNWSNMLGDVNQNDIHFRILRAYIGTQSYVMEDEEINSLITTPDPNNLLQRELPDLPKLTKLRKTISSSTKIIFSFWEIVFAILIGRIFTYSVESLFLI